MSTVEHALNELDLDDIFNDRSSIRLSMNIKELSDGSSFHVLDEGQGEPVIFIPIIGEINFVYSSQIAAFKSHHRVILYEPKISLEHYVDLSDRADELLLLMDTLDIHKAHLVGWSDAGAVAYYLAKKNPEKWHSVVFISLSDAYGLPQPLQFFSTMLWNFPIEEFVPSWFVALLLGYYLRGRGIRFNWIVNYALQFENLPKLVKYNILPNLFAHKPRYSEVTVPCLVICGDDDRVVSVKQARRLTRLLPMAEEIAIISRGEHFLCYVNASEVNHALLHFYFSLGS